MENEEKVEPVANDPQVQVNDSAAEHAQTIESDQQNEVAQPEQQPLPRKKIKAKHGLKPLAFFSGLFDIVVGLVIIGLGVWTSANLFNSFDTGTTEEFDRLLGSLFLPVIILILAITGIAGILFLLDGIITLISSFKSDRKNWNGLIIAATVFDALLLVSSTFVSFSSEGKTQTISIIFTTVLAVTLVFKIVDVSLTRRRLKKYQEAKMEEYKQTYHGPDFSQLGKTLGENETRVKSQPQNSENAQHAQGGDDSNSENDQNSSGGVDFSQLGK